MNSFKYLSLLYIFNRSVKKNILTFFERINNKECNRIDKNYIQLRYIIFFKYYLVNCLEFDLFYRHEKE